MYLYIHQLINLKIAYWQSKQKSAIKALKNTAQERGLFIPGLSPIPQLNTFKSSDRRANIVS